MDIEIRPRGDMHLRTTIADLVSEHGLAEVLRAVSDACDVESDLASTHNDAQELVRIGVQVRILGDDVEEIVGPMPVCAPMVSSADIVRVVQQIAEGGE